MTPFPSYRPGERFQTVSGRSGGRIGAVFYDERGRAVGITARHLFEGEPSKTLHHPASGEVIGHTINPNGFGRRSSDEGIELVRLSRPDAWISEPHDRLSGAVDPDDVLGKPVSALGQGCAGLVTGVGGLVRLVGPRGIRTLRGLTEVTLDHDISVADQPAGLLFTDTFGFAVGVLLGSSGRKAYLSPLIPTLARYRLSFTRINRSADPSEATLDQQVDALLTQIDHAVLTAQNMRRSHSRGYQDVDVPDRVLELLD